MKFLFREVRKMKIKNVLILVLLFAFGFSRASSDYQVVLAPDLIFSAAFHHAGAKIIKGPSKDGDSIKWKRRHKRRKKMRRPQRGK
tara:strand:+ start:114 stop:371 length:258 start_codon:yes stop_codon:yes gene_type:complete